MKQFKMDMLFSSKAAVNFFVGNTFFPEFFDNLTHFQDFFGVVFDMSVESVENCTKRVAKMSRKIQDKLREKA